MVGKPSVQFFATALSDMGLSASETVMVGDDVQSDVGGAQRSGGAGRARGGRGKFRAADERREDVRPDDVVDNLAACVRKLVQ